MNFIQLAVRGPPTAFDMSPSNDLCAVASSSPGCIAFFHLHEHGSPRNVIHYEQPYPVRQLNFQRHSQQLLAALRGDSVSLFDPSKALRPLYGLIRSKGVIQDMQWSHAMPNILATCCDAGDLALWDCRSLSKAALVSNFNFPIQGIEWCPSNNNLLLIKGENQVLVWDSRLNKAPSASSMSITSKDRDRDRDNRQLFSMSFTDNIVHSLWCHDDSRPSIVMSTTAQKLEWLQQVEGSDSCDFAKHAVMSSPAPFNRKDRMLASTVGRGLVYTQVSQVISTDGISAGKTSVFLQGHARSGYNLDSIFQNPNQTKQSSDILTDGPRQKIATIDDNIVGMKWGTPGRLLPPAHSGLELLFLTESSRLYAVKLPADVVKHHCGGLASSAVSNDPGKPMHNQRKGNGNTTGGGTSSQQVAVAESSCENAPPTNPIFALDSLRTSWFPSSSINHLGLNPFREVNSSENFLKRSSQSQDNLNNTNDNNSAVAMSNIRDSSGEIFWQSLQREILSLQDHIDKGAFDGLVIGRLDQYAKQITLEMRGGGVNLGSMMIDREMNAPRNLDAGGTASNDGSASSIKEFLRDDTISLIIYFPLKFPTLGLPQFTLRAANSSNFSDGALSTAIIKELSQISQSVIDPVRSKNLEFSMNNDKTDNITGFLIDIARCFRNRILQPFTNSISNNSDSVRNPFADTNSNNNGGFSGGSSNSMDKSRNDGEEEVNTVSDDIIKPKAYRIPFPATSGAIFGCNGKLICFGGARPVSKLSNNSNNCNEKTPSASYCADGILEKDIGKDHVHPKTYADLQALSRWIRENEEITLKEEEEVEREKQASSDRSSDSEDEDSDRSLSDGDNDGDESVGSNGGGGGRSKHAYKKTAPKSSIAKGVSKESKEIPIPANLQHFQPLLANYASFIAGHSKKISNADTSPMLLNRKEVSPQNAGLQTESLKTYIISNFSSPSNSILFPNGRHGFSNNLDNNTNANGNGNGDAIVEGMLVDGDDNIDGWKTEVRNTLNAPLQTTFTIYDVKDGAEVDIIDFYELGLHQYSLCQKSIIKNPKQPYQLEVNKKGLDERLDRCRSYISALKLSNRENPNKLTASLVLWWNMLSVSLEILALPWEGGTLISWTESSLGCSLMFELFCYLRHSRMTATLATAVCLLGGSQVVADLLMPEISKRLSYLKPSSSSSSGGCSGGISNVPANIKTNALVGLWSPQETALFMASDAISTEASWIYFLEYSLKVYIAFLGREGLLVKAIEASKYLAQEKKNNNSDEVPISTRQLSTILFCSSCGTCNEKDEESASTICSTNHNIRKINSDRCETCSKKTIYCSVCVLPVKSFNIFCLGCGHGGHPNHLAAWFEVSKFCATGCGCACNFDSYFEDEDDDDNENYDGERDEDQSDLDDDDSHSDVHVVALKESKGSDGKLSRKYQNNNSDTESSSDDSESSSSYDDSDSNSTSSNSDSNSSSDASVGERASVNGDIAMGI